MKLALSKINIDNSTQVRVGLNAERVEQYTENYKAGVPMPDVVCFADGQDNWIGDGFHRCAGAKVAGLEEIGADVREGTRLDAILYSLTCNDKHGLPLSNADKRNGVRNILKEKTWATRSDRWIADAVKVSERLVASVRAESTNQEESTTTAQSSSSTENNGEAPPKTTRTERVGKDGKKRKASSRKGGPNAGKHAGQSQREKAAARIAGQRPAGLAAGMVTCPKCRGKGQITEAQAKAMAFTPPTVEEVKAYCDQIDADKVDPEHFVDHYTANGWMVGKVKMKDWQATVRKWKVSPFNANGKAKGRRFKVDDIK